MEYISRLLDVAIYALFIYAGYLLGNRKQTVKTTPKEFIPLPAIPVQDVKTSKKEEKEELNTFFN